MAKVCRPLPNWLPRLLSTCTQSLLLVLCLYSACQGQTITFWHPWTQGRNVVDSLAADYFRRTRVRVQVKVLDPQTYNPWTGGAQPDIIGLSYPNRGGVAGNARRGRLYNLAPYLQQGWYVDLWPGPLAIFDLRGIDAPKSGPGIYGVPLTCYVKLFIYNKGMFRKAGVAPPRTWVDLLYAAQKLRRLGVIPMAGGLEGSYPSFPTPYERSYLGTIYLEETYFGRYSYTSQRWRNQFRMYQEMRRYGLTTYDAGRMARSNAEKYFLDGHCALILDGPWFEPARKWYAPSFSDWSVFGPPQDSRAPFLADAPGGVAEGVVINAGSKNKVAAIRFLQWMTQPPQQVRLANAMGSLPISEQASRSGSLYSYLRVFAAYMRYAAIDLRYYENPAVLNKLYTGARNVIRGTQTPDQALNAAQKQARRSK